jgi:hypothetical protein
MKRREKLRENILFYEWSSGFYNKHHFFVLPTPSAGFDLSDNGQCCYRTLNLINKDMTLA